ncbi:MAG: patatin-like phospholipase family protein, partial [Actinomycetota bacterium]
MTLEQRQNIRNPLAHWPKPLAVVLSGGGAYGAVQVGMLQALEEAGIVPDMVVGTSVGALNGALLAADRDTAVERLTGVWNKMDRGVFGGRNRFSLTLSALRNGLRSNNQALSSPHALRSLIDKHLPVE